MNLIPATARQHENDPETWIDRLPKADIHIHAETIPRLARLITQSRGLEVYDHAATIAHAMAEVPAGLPRLLALDQALTREGNERAGFELIGLIDQPDYLEASYELLMEEAASDGVLIVEMRIGSGVTDYPHFLKCFRDAERRVASRHPGFHAEPIVAWITRRASLVEREVNRTLAIAAEGVAGIDFYPDNHPDFDTIYRWAGRAAAVGLPVTCHAGEFGPENLRKALAIPGLRRLGHAVHAPSVPGLLDAIASRGITVEVALTSNVVLGVVPSYEEHPIRKFIDAGVSVTLASDDPIRFGTSISREYREAVALGFSKDELVEFTRNGIAASFTTPARKEALFAALVAAQ